MEAPHNMNPPSTGMNPGKDKARGGIFRTGSGQALRQIELAAMMWERRLLDTMVGGLLDAAVFFTDAQGKITSQSPALERLLGYPASETIGRSASDFLFGGKAARQAIRHKLSEQEQVIRRAVLVKAKSGRRLRCALTAKVVKDAGGRVAGVVGSLQSRSDAIGSDGEQRCPNTHSSAREAGGKAVIWLDGDGHIIRWDESAGVMFGYTKSEVIGRSLSMILPDRRARFRIAKAVHDEADEQESARSLDILVTDRSGAALRLETVSKLLRDEAGKVTGREISFSELTGSGSAQFEQTELPFAGPAGQTAARIAHELKNPLSAIYLNIEMLDSLLKLIPDEGARKEAREIIGSVMIEVEHLESVTREFLAKGAAPPMHFCSQSLSEMMLELQRFMEKEMKSLNIIFVNDFQESLPDLCFDKNRMREVILNLYENAADAMPNGGKIESTACLCGNWLEIRISDTGSGVSDADAEKLFEPFFTTKEMGTGLGLSIVEETLRAHGGAIEFLPDPAEGTVFLMRLPLS